MQMFGFLVTVVLPNKKWKQKSNRKISTVAHMFFVSSDASAALGVVAA